MPNGTPCRRDAPGPTLASRPSPASIETAAWARSRPRTFRNRHRIPPSDRTPLFDPKRTLGYTPSVMRARLGWVAMTVAAGFLGCAHGPRAGKLAPGVTFDGRWDSNFHEMQLHQQGRKVWGTVAYR